MNDVLGNAEGQMPEAKAAFWTDLLALTQSERAVTQALDRASAAKGRVSIASAA